MASIEKKLQSVVGAAGVLTGKDVSARPENFGRTEHCRARAIVRPANTEELSQVLRICHEARQCVVPMGGNTGLVQGAVANETEILLSTERMTAIENVDVDSGTMTVQAGVPLQAVQDRAEAEDLYFPLDYGARGSATIGGAISTNAGGNAVVRFGMAREQVLGLEAVLADGTVMTSLNTMLKNNAGYDLKQLFIGTEGTLGVVTRAVLRLRPALRSQNTALVAVDEFAAIPALLRQLGAGLGGSLNAFEVLWADFYELILETASTHSAPIDTGHPFYVLVESRGGGQLADSQCFEQTLQEALEAQLIVDASIASSSSQRDAMWAIRDDIDTLVQGLLPPIIFDISVPVAVADTYVNNVKNRLQQRWQGAARTATFGHLGDSNIHLCVSIGSLEHDSVQQVMRTVYEELQPFGGSISAEHGVGLEKRPYLEISRSPNEIRLMKTLKKALDPQGILNPGKIFTL